MGPKTKSAHLLEWHCGERVTMGQFSNSFPKHFSYLCEYAFRFDLSCSFCEYPIIFHCLHCSPSCFDPDSLLLAHLWLGLSWIDSISANERFSSCKTSSRKPYTSSKQQERQKHSAETTINFSENSQRHASDNQRNQRRSMNIPTRRQGHGNASLSTSMRISTMSHKRHRSLLMVYHAAHKLSHLAPR